MEYDVCEIVILDAISIFTMPDFLVSRVIHSVKNLPLHTSSLTRTIHAYGPQSASLLTPLEGLADMQTVLCRPLRSHSSRAWTPICCPIMQSVLLLTPPEGVAEYRNASHRLHVLLAFSSPHLLRVVAAGRAGR